MRFRFIVLLPLLLSIAGFVLALLIIFAGNKPGYMEEYHIVYLNMSNFGKDLIPTPTSGGNNPTSTGSGIGNFFSNIIESAASELSDIADDIADDIVDKLAAELGISQWYSLHMLDACNGNFAPNATAPGAWFNATNCTQQRGGYQFNITEALDHELKVGPLKLNLADLQFPPEIQDQIDLLNGFMLAIFVLSCLGAGFSGLAIILSLLAFFSEPLKRVVLTNGTIAGLAGLTLFIGALVTTIGSKKAADKISEQGSKVGISAQVGKNFQIISWVAFAVMAAAFVYWVVDFFLSHRKRKDGRRWKSSRSEKRYRHSSDV